MSGAEYPADHNQPETPAPEAVQVELDLTWGELEDLLMGLEADPNQKVQSIFSSRSGIQDLLQKSEMLEESADPEPLAPDLDEEDAEPIPLPVRPERRPGGRHHRSRRQLNRVRRRQKSYLEKRREEKRMRLFYQRIRLCFKLCFAMLWMVLLWEMLHSPLWNFKQPYYKVHNQHLIPAGDLAGMVNRQVGKPIYAIDTGKMAADIKKRYDVAELVSVRRRMFPAKLDITVAEKMPWAEIYLDPKQTRPYALLVPNGLVNLNRYIYRPGLYPGATLEKILLAPNTRFRLSFINHLHEIAWQARQIPGLHLLSVDARNPHMIVLNFAETQVILGRLDHNATERLGRLLPLVPKITELREGIQSVDLRWEEQVTFHTKPELQTRLRSPGDAG